MKHIALKILSKLQNKLVLWVKYISVFTFLYVFGGWLKNELEKVELSEENAIFFVYNDIDSVYISSLVALELARECKLRPIFLSFYNVSHNVDVLSRRVNNHSHSNLDRKEVIRFIRIGNDSIRNYQQVSLDIKEFSDKYKNFCINGMPVGDLIIDSVIRNQNKFPSQEVLFDEKKLIHEVNLFASTYSNLVNSLHPKKAFLVETGYIGLGILKRTLLQKNIPLFHLHPVCGVAEIQKINDLFGSELLYSRSQVNNILESANIDYKTVETYYKSRFLGQVNEPDAKIAYSKQLKSPTNFNLKSGKLLKVLYLHAFKDMNHFSHVGKVRLFETYLDWTVHTLKTILKDKSSDWIVKMHPCSYMYGEEDYTLNFLLSILGEEKGSIRILSNEIPSFEILKNADMIYTFDGTIAVEFACLGKASVCLGNRYWDYQFALTPKTIDEYDEMLLSTNTDMMPQLKHQDIIDAQKLIYATLGMMPFHKHIGSAITLPNCNFKLLQMSEALNALKLLRSFFANILLSQSKSLTLSNGIKFIDYLKGIESIYK
jgi:hypothetical protein